MLTINVKKKVAVSVALILSAIHGMKTQKATKNVDEQNKKLWKAAVRLKFLLLILERLESILEPDNSPLVSRLS